MNEPYLAITGFATLEEIHAFAARVGAAERSDTLPIVCGVLVSRDTLHGGAPPAVRYPLFSEVRGLLSAIRGFASAAVHFNSRSEAPLSEQLTELFAAFDMYESGLCRRVQINVAAPDPAELARFRDRHPEAELVLQLPLWRPELQAAQALHAFLAPYRGIVQHVLFDPSGGRGAGLDPALLPRIREAAEGAPGFVPGIAGGLYADNVAAVVVAAQSALGRAFSLDAEGKLRGGTLDGRRIGDRLNAEKAARFVGAVRAALAGTATERRLLGPGSDR